MVDPQTSPWTTRPLASWVGIYGLYLDPDPTIRYLEVLIQFLAETALDTSAPMWYTSPVVVASAAYWRK